MPEVDQPAPATHDAESPPVDSRQPPEKAPDRRDGTGLALSGGGYRASLFGLGSLWRLNELGQLPTLRRITSVSGGSITAGVLATSWGELHFDDHGCATNFTDIVARRVRDFCSHTLDWETTLLGLTSVFSAAGVARRVFESRLTRKADGKIARLSDLPASGHGPEFIFYATCMQTGSSFRFSREGLYDWKLGRLPRVDISLGTAIAASAAFPPFLSPLKLRTKPDHWLDRPAVKGLKDTTRIRKKLYLGDGGIYDNMGIEALWRSMACVLVSDAGAPFAYVDRPYTNWPAQLGRVRDILIEQTRALRRREFIGDLIDKCYEGTYWGISTSINDYTTEPKLCTDNSVTKAFANISTRLKSLDERTQMRLINWGYALADAAVRTYVTPSAPCGQLPFPQSPLQAP